MKQLSKNKKSISIVFGTYNRLPFLKLTIESVRKEIERFLGSCEIIVVDGGSDDGTIEWLCQQKDIISIIQHNRGVWHGRKIERRSWGYFMNLGFKISQGKYICMISDDCLLVPGVLASGYETFEKHLHGGVKIGALAFYWRNWSQERQFHVGFTLGKNMYVNHGMFLRSALQEVGYAEEDEMFFYNSDGDICLKMLEKGYRCLVSENSYVEHYPHANTDVRKSNYIKYRKDVKNYLSKWEGIFYDKRTDIRGKSEWKDFEDAARTGDLFLSLHKGIVEKNPRLLRGKDFRQRAFDFFKWKYKACVKRIRNVFSDV
jgi:glycosyltransferase involved in cell wall biosynthesis